MPSTNIVALGVAGGLAIGFLAGAHARSRGAVLPDGSISTFEAVREATGWVRPGGDHGCVPAEIAPGVFNAHYHDIDSADKLRAVAPRARLVINTAPAQCPRVDYGLAVAVLDIPLEDDPDERKWFDAGKPTQSSCKTVGLPLTKRCSGNARQHFEKACDAIDATLAAGGGVVIHCHASLSRSAAFALAWLMRSRAIGVVEAVRAMRPLWEATWPCDRFVHQLIDYERELRAPSAVRAWLLAHPVA
jgi:hypothetical protein